MVGAEDVESLQEVEPATRDHAGGPGIRGRWKLVGGQLRRTPLETPVRRTGAVGGDGMQPGCEPAPPGEGVDPRRDQQQRVLGRLLGVLRVQQHPAADAAYAWLDLR